MTDFSGARLYSGEGIRISERNLRLPLFERPSRLDAAEYYIAEKGLTDAVNVALTLEASRSWSLVSPAPAKHN